MPYVETSCQGNIGAILLPCSNNLSPKMSGYNSKQHIYHHHHHHHHHHHQGLKPVFQDNAGLGCRLISLRHLTRSCASRVWSPSRHRSSGTQFCQVFFGLSAGTVHSTAITVQPFTQSASPFRCTSRFHT